jgi:hypothetical protein
MYILKLDKIIRCHCVTNIRTNSAVWPKPLKPTSSNVYHLFDQPTILRSAHKVYLLLSCNYESKTAIISLNSVNQLIFVTVKCGAFLAVRTEC